MAFAKVTLLGNLGKDPEDFEYNGRGGKQTGTKFSLAVSTGKDDKRVTDWFNCTCFGGVAKTAKDWLTKGKSVIVMGKITLRKWEGKEGKAGGSNMEVNVDSIEFVPNGDGAKTNGAPAAAAAAPAGSTRNSAPAADPNDDDCPF